MSEKLPIYIQENPKIIFLCYTVMRNNAYYTYHNRYTFRQLLLRIKSISIISDFYSVDRTNLFIFPTCKSQHFVLSTNTFLNGYIY